MGRARLSTVIAVDTSAMVAIALGEPERDAFRATLAHAGKALISTASVLETRMALYGRRGPRAVVLIDDLFRLPMFDIVPPGPAELEAAFGAFVVFGKGSGHAAALNYGDLFAYALAKVRSLPLLFKGSDFAETDIVPAITVPLP
jgi:ribonuclease VapC